MVYGEFYLKSKINIMIKVTSYLLLITVLLTAVTAQSQNIDKDYFYELKAT